MIEFKGEPAQLPSGLAVATELAEIFSEENSDANIVRIDLRPGQMRIRGEGNTGRATEVKALKYDGPKMTFFISPILLKQIVKKHTACEITKDKLKVNGGKWVYVTSFAVKKVNKDE